ncbi:glycosyltransferase family 2 protein [Pedobacter sp. UYP1]|uniref:glycosyltransferase family 2 protein n=1 Tax=Pedobacter sp. UYP1 TaxID=1756396 RepID=UPI003399A069
MLEKYPKITVITPSFNQGAYLEHTITSILNQGYPNLEYIVIDGGSTDHSVEIIKKYEHLLTYWVSEKDNGLYHALQKGFARSTGEIMCWINSDDMHHRRSLMTIAELFKDFPDINWIMGKNTFYDEQGREFIYGTNMFNERWSKWKMYDQDGEYIQQESVFWRRSLWEKSGAYIDTNLSLASDAELWLRFFRHDQLYSTELLLSGFRFRSGIQKSKDQREEYIVELSTVIQRELSIGNTRAYFQFMRFIKFFAKLVPLFKLKSKIIMKVMAMPPKIVYNPDGTYRFSWK